VSVDDVSGLESVKWQILHCDWPDGAAKLCMRHQSLLSSIALVSVIVSLVVSISAINCALVIVLPVLRQKAQHYKLAENVTDFGASAQEAVDDVDVMAADGSIQRPHTTDVFMLHVGTAIHQTPNLNTSHVSGVIRWICYRAGPDTLLASSYSQILPKF